MVHLVATVYRKNTLQKKLGADWQHPPYRLRQSHPKNTGSLKNLSFITPGCHAPFFLSYRLTFVKTQPVAYNNDAFRGWEMNMSKDSTPPLLPLLGGVAGGILYFAVAERHVGKANCSWRDPVTTDMASMAMGSYLAWRGTVLREPVIALAGAATLAIHISQLVANKPRRAGE
jgi:hypothetical protein